MFALLPLLGKDVDQLSVEDIAAISKTLNINIPITEELRTAGIALLKGENIHKVADLIKSPDSIQKLLSMFAPKIAEPAKVVVRCPHCELFFIN